MSLGDGLDEREPVTVDDCDTVTHVDGEPDSVLDVDGVKLVDVVAHMLAVTERVGDNVGLTEPDTVLEVVCEALGDFAPAPDVTPVDDGESVYDAVEHALVDVVGDVLSDRLPDTVGETLAVEYADAVVQIVGDGLPE